MRVVLDPSLDALPVTPATGQEVPAGAPADVAAPISRTNDTTDDAPGPPVPTPTTPTAAPSSFGASLLTSGGIRRASDVAAGRPAEELPPILRPRPAGPAVSSGPPIVVPGASATASPHSPVAPALASAGSALPEAVDTPAPEAAPDPGAAPASEGAPDAESVPAPTAPPQRSSRGRRRSSEPSRSSGPSQAAEPAPATSEPEDVALSPASAPPAPGPTISAAAANAESMTVTPAPRPKSRRRKGAAAGAAAVPAAIAATPATSEEGAATAGDAEALDVEVAQLAAAPSATGASAAASAIVEAPVADPRSVCEHCGTAVEPSVRFCPTCGHRVNVWRALPDLGPDAGVSLVPATAAIQPGTEPPPRFPVRVVALAVGGVVVIAIVVLVGAFMFGSRPRASQTGSPAPGAAVASSSANHRLSVEVQVDQTLGAGNDPWSRVQVGGPCEPVREAFPDIRAGTPVLLADQSGAVLARSTLRTGRKAAPGLCSYATNVNAPDANRYGIGIADRTAIEFSFDELSQAGWTTLIKYVEAP